MKGDSKIETEKIIEKLFVFADNRDQETNLERKLIVNP